MDYQAEKKCLLTSANNSGTIALTKRHTYILPVDDETTSYTTFCSYCRLTLINSIHWAIFCFLQNISDVMISLNKNSKLKDCLNINLNGDISDMRVTVGNKLSLVKTQLGQTAISISALSWRI